MYTKCVSEAQEQGPSPKEINDKMRSNDRSLSAIDLRNKSRAAKATHLQNRLNAVPKVSDSLQDDNQVAEQAANGSVTHIKKELARHRARRNGKTVGEGINSMFLVGSNAAIRRTEKPRRLQNENTVSDQSSPVVPEAEADGDDNR